MCSARGALEQLLALGVDADLQALFFGRAHVLTMAVHRFGVNYAAASWTAGSTTPNAAFTATVAAASIWLCREGWVVRSAAWPSTSRTVTRGSERASTEPVAWRRPW